MKGRGQASPDDFCGESCVSSDTRIIGDGGVVRTVGSRGAASDRARGDELGNDDGGHSDPVAGVVEAGGADERRTYGGTRVGSVRLSDGDHVQVQAQ